MTKRILIIFLLAANSILLQAQQTAVYHDPDRLYKQAYELFSKEMKDMYKIARNLNLSAFFPMKSHRTSLAPATCFHR